MERISSMAIKKLRRSSTNKMLAGVCGGIADYFNIDATIVRLVFAGVALITAGTGLVAYGVAWLILPDDNDGEIGLDKVADFYTSHRNRPAPDA